MEIEAIRPSETPELSRVLYSKKDKLYVRTGSDGFRLGKPFQSTIEGALYKWGFYRVENPPKFIDAEDILENISNFHLTNKNVVQYEKPQL